MKPFRDTAQKCGGWIRRRPIRATLLGLCLAATLAAAIFPMTLFDRGIQGYLAFHGIHRREVSVDGFNIHYLDGGPKDAPVVVLLHGFGGDAESSWLTMAPALARKYRVVAPNMLFGSPSNIRIERYSIHRELLMVESLLRRLEIDKAHWVGLSTGGWVALLAALDAPDLVDRLVLICPAGVQTDLTAIRDIAFSATVSSAQLVDLFFYRKPPFASSAFPTASPKARLRRNKNLLVGKVLIAQGPFLDDRLGDIDKPALIVWGRQDRVFDWQTGERIRDAIPGSRLEVYDECGHAVVWDQGKRLRRDLLEFLD